jgi:hypothetical protein
MLQEASAHGEGYMSDSQAATELLLRLNHARQTLDFVKRQMASYARLDKAHMSIMQVRAGGGSGAAARLLCALCAGTGPVVRNGQRWMHGGRALCARPTLQLGRWLAVVVWGGEEST